MISGPQNDNSQQGVVDPPRGYVEWSGSGKVEWVGRFHVESEFFEGVLSRQRRSQEQVLLLPVVDVALTLL